nr:putative RNA-directed DNA polymerase, eukaryota, reverse transcriptase zinc-binding domain protein [Tanacetum cinerariifolium]
NNVNYSVRVRELCSWTPTFVGEEFDCELKNFDDNHDISVENDVESTGDIFEEPELGNYEKNQEPVQNELASPFASPLKDVSPDVVVDIDPFNLEHLIKQSGTKQKPSKSDIPDFPPGFSPIIRENHAKPELDSDGGVFKHSGFSMVERLEETIKYSSMNCISINSQGLGDLNKRRWLRDLVHVHNVNFLAIQETKMLHVDLWMLRQIWGNVHFDFAFSSARGLSGGIICCWNPLVFRKSRILCDDNYVVIDGVWIPKDVQLKWTVVYAPQSPSRKISLWSSISNDLANWDGISVIMGDFNVVRKECERFGSVFCERQATSFNDFIVDNSLIDIPLGGYSFTWTNKWGTKMSKLDRFLVSDNFLEVFPHVTGLILEKGIPDHRPILFKESCVDYGPTPFRFFNSWLETDGFRDLVVSTWKCDGIVDSNAFNLFKKKLQNLKKVIREWNISRKADLYAVKKEHQHCLSLIHSRIDQGCASEEDFLSRRESLTILGKLDYLEAKDLAQKAKVRWACERDENSSFFHGTFKKKRRQLAIKGVLKDGVWIEDPGVVKEEFFLHFLNRFKKPSCPPIDLGPLNFRSLSQAQHDFLEIPFSRDEIKKAVWDCGCDRAPGPDGFTFGFFTAFWDVIEEDVVRFILEFSRTHNIPKGCNPSFIALILKSSNARFVSDFRPISLIGCQYKIIGKLLANRLSMVIGDCVSPVQSAFIKGRCILDGPLILNEIMAEYRCLHKKLLLFKVDFEKAFDSVRWDYLDAVMLKMGFGSKWRSWISGSLHNVRSSVLVNGSPTKEFELFKGLRQGDPLSPFLFILAMEGLHSLMCKAKELGLFKGANIGRDNIKVSHLMYADDVLFFGEWSRSNVQNLISIIQCFYLISGLKIKIDKSNVLGVGASVLENAYIENSIGCGVSKIPLTYLGIPVGCNMSRTAHWNSVIHKFSSKLTSWKAKLFSVGGRLSLIKAVLGNLPTYFMSIYLMPSSVLSNLEAMRSKFFRGANPSERKMSWIKWERCVSSKEKCGLGIGSIFGLNMGLLFKWIWRILTRPSDIWAKLGNGVSISFWEDIWCGNSSLKSQFPRVYNLDPVRTCSVSQRISLNSSYWVFVLRRSLRGGAELAQFKLMLGILGDVTLSDHCDSWVWSRGSSTMFTVASARDLVENSLLSADNVATRWLRHLPIKINVFLWRLNINRLPSSVNLDRKGIEVDSLLCPICRLDVETVNHLFFNCDMAKDLWAIVAKWWELDVPLCSNISDWYSWLD